MAAVLQCPIHGEVEGLSLTEGPLSEPWPWPLVCEKCEPEHTVVVGYSWEVGDKEVHSPNWEDAPL
jgi:hypothetical protein